jgi:dephospho-CoA kinase
VLRVGLTGGLACGKTTVARMFEERGIPVLYADLLAHELMQPGLPVYEEIVRAFGADILSGAMGTAIDRARLAAKAFAPGASRVQELNAIVHPAVIRAEQEWMDQIEARDPNGIAVVEAALIYEADHDDHFDKMIVVVAPEAQKIERYAERVVRAFELLHGVLPPEERERRLQAKRDDAKQRIASQIPDDVKRAKAEIVIENSGSTAELQAQVDSIVARLRQKSTTEGTENTKKGLGKAR